VAGYGGPRSGSRLRPYLRTGVCPVPCRTFIGAPLRAYFLREEGHPFRFLIAYVTSFSRWLEMTLCPGCCSMCHGWGKLPLPRQEH
jgi:hypothetical protein